MESQKLLSLVRQALKDYEMIVEGDMIAVGVSGGKDSLTLLFALSRLKDFYPVKFSIKAFTVDLGFKNVDFTGIGAYCNKLGIEYEVINTEIGRIIFDIRNESNPCSLCSKMRKGALNDAVKAQGFNKIAYAHHMDDVNSTFMLSLLYEGRLNTFSPVTYLDNTELTVIRPLIYVKEVEVKGFVNKYGIPVVKSPCPADKHTKREYINELIKEINRENPGSNERIFTAIRNSGLEGWKNNE